MIDNTYGFDISEPERIRSAPRSHFFVCTLTALSICVGDNSIAMTLSQSYCNTENTELCADYSSSVCTTNMMLNRLEQLRSSLGHGWDGRDGIPVESESYRNTQNAIKSLPRHVMTDWNLFPCPNGTLLLTNKENSASINIGNKDFSYVAYQDAEHYVKGVMVYSDESFLIAVKNIDEVLGYDID